MGQSLAIDDFLAQARASVVADVRTPAEFARGHIPGAINIPLFDDTERAAVGTTYKRSGQAPAIQLGLRLVGPKLADLAAALGAAAARSSGPLLLHCWRGGMRSSSMAWLAGLSGHHARTLAGGYKAFRRWVLDPAGTARQTHVLAGLTGAGKTAVLHEMAAQGATVIDLEALARHKGSVFGDLGEPPQPSQEQFENDLLVAWRATNPDSPVWVEDESRTIGSCHLPASIWTALRNGARHLLEVPDHVRVAHLRETYTAYPADTLIARINAIRKRLGGDRADLAIQAIRSGDMAGACILALAYYDRGYRHCLAATPAPPVATFSFAAFNARHIATTILSSTR